MSDRYLTDAACAAMQARHVYDACKCMPALLDDRARLVALMRDAVRELADHAPEPEADEWCRVCGGADKWPCVVALVRDTFAAALAEIDGTED